MNRALVAEFLTIKLGVQRIREIVRNGEQEEVIISPSLTLRLIGIREERHLELSLYAGSHLVENMVMSMFMDFGITEFVGRNYRPDQR